MIRRSREAILAAKRRYYYRNKEREKRKRATLRRDAKMSEVSEWTKTLRLLNKPPRVVETLDELVVLWDQWEFGSKPVVSLLTSEGIRIARSDGYGGTILYTGRHAGRLFTQWQSGGLTSRSGLRSWDRRKDTRLLYGS